MEINRKSIAKKLCIYLISTCLISTSIFMSYSNSIQVYAIDDDFDYGGYLKVVVGLGLTIGGVIETVVSGGSLSPMGIAQITTGLAISGIEIKDYLTDNGDGTFTVTPEFVQLCIDEAIKQENSYFSDYASIQNVDGSYSVSGTCTLTSDGYTVYYIFSGTTTYKPFAVITDNSYGVGLAFSCYNGISSSRLSLQYEGYRDGKLRYTGSTTANGANDGYAFNIPIFSSLDAALSAFETGDFSSALNYREKMFEYGSIYAPVYNGGSVTIRKEVLDGFEDKLKEVNEKYDDVDDRINALYEYIFNNNIGNNGSGTGFDFDFDIDSPFDLGELFNGLFKDWEGFGSSFVTSLADFFKELADGMKKKFPFSIPWDIYHIFMVFSNVDSPQAADISTISFTDINSGISIYTVDSEDLEQDVHDAPYFKLPIKVESFGIYEEIIVDMKDFQTLSTFSRTMFSLLFAVFLLKFTIKILSIFGVFGGGDD